MWPFSFDFRLAGAMTSWRVVDLEATVELLGALGQWLDGPQGLDLGEREIGGEPPLDAAKVVHQVCCDRGVMGTRLARVLHVVNPSDSAGGVS